MKEEYVSIEKFRIGLTDYMEKVENNIPIVLMKYSKVVGVVIPFEAFKEYRSFFEKILDKH
jgi:hypothetical protein